MGFTFRGNDTNLAAYVGEDITIRYNPRDLAVIRVSYEGRSLNHEDSRLFLEQQWRRWGLTLNPENATETDAIAAIIRITNGNFRLLQRLLVQIGRIADINALRMISKEVVEIARQQVVIGSN